jgi:hypothetical protein
MYGRATVFVSRSWRITSAWSQLGVRSAWVKGFVLSFHHDDLNKDQHGSTARHNTSQPPTRTPKCTTHRSVDRYGEANPVTSLCFHSIDADHLSVKINQRAT